MKRLLIVTALLTGLVATGLGQTAQERQAVIQDQAILQFINSQFPPTDPQPTCIVKPAAFAAWFQTGGVTLNGVVNPANSVAFAGGGIIPAMARTAGGAGVPNNPRYNQPNCNFYQWSEQMFLWLTSPAPRAYGGGARIFDSPAFFDVSPPDASGHRTLIPHVPGKIRTFPVRIAQRGVHNLPIVSAKDGRLLEVEPQELSASGKRIIRDEAGNSIEVEQAKIESGKLVLLDGQGKQIPMARPQLRQAASPTLSVQKFLIGSVPVFVNSSGNVVEVEQGQAGGDGVLQAQNGSLVYYETIVNDVYAYFLTGAKDGKITPNTQFPTTQADLAKIVNFAQFHGRTFPDPNALAIEVKTSWVEAGSLPNPGSYITMTATVPTYNTSNQSLWVPNGQKTVQLAMVGMHVVGSTSGHPEMIWATFEHAGNAPLATYAYINTSGQTRTVTQNTAGTWLFSAGNAAAPFNDLHMSFVSPNIAATALHTISPSNTIRWKAWGAASDYAPNPAVASSAASNTEVIAINNSIRGMLAGNDVRKNYIMSGATWTIGGAAPTGRFKNPGGGNEVGTSMLAATSMETYQQGTNTLWSGGSNCFSCHTTNTTGVSHVFAAIKPLF